MITSPTPMVCDIATLVPGGIRPTDLWHKSADNDETCSRCGRLMSRHIIPLTLWSSKGNNMLMYGECCTGGPVVVPKI